MEKPQDIKSEYNNNKFKTSPPTWNDAFDLPDGSYSITDTKLFKIMENTYNVGAGEAGYNEDKVCKNEVVNPLKPLTTFWRALNIPLINCEIELILT